ncbi:MAG: carboxylesterase family protein [Alphaproteobacteria bacterium]|nr:carboxylesterase family protein [Alphaproteobacteria bacterium]
MKSVVSGAAALALVILAGCAASPAPTQEASAAPKAKVDGGVIVGEAADGINTFKGVPYAAAPVGDLRWEPPKAVVAWSGDRAATEFGASCSQSTRLGREVKTSEDCLFLNVYAPAKAKKAPVMVWIHGGSNLNGSGSIYNGAAFAKDGIVTVTINYRMGALGFFAHPAITAAAGPNEPLADYGLMDQTAALQWVKRNISKFGGDPDKVTVFGESAGAIDIYALLGLKSSKGLFNQAILESNITWGDSLPLAKAEEEGKALAVRAGASETATLAELRALPADKLVAAAGGAQFPMVDGRFMTETSLQAVANGHTLDIPTIIGTNSFEASLIYAREKDPQKLVDWTNAQAGAPARFIATKTAGGKPTWLYFFSYLPTAIRDTPRGANGASHASEIAFVYGGMTRPFGGAAQAEPSDEDKAMAALMHSCWVAFAKTGAPKCASGPAWPKYDPAMPELMEFGMPSGVRADFRKAELDAATAAESGAR